VGRDSFPFADLIALRLGRALLFTSCRPRHAWKSICPEDPNPFGRFSRQPPRVRGNRGEFFLFAEGGEGVSHYYPPRENLSRHPCPRPRCSDICNADLPTPLSRSYTSIIRLSPNPCRLPRAAPSPRFLERSTIWSFFAKVQDPSPL